MRLTKGSLADPVLWRKVHNPWISEIYHALKPLVLGRLSLSIDQEITLIEPEAPPRSLRTDVHLTDLGSAGASPLKPASTTGAIAYAEGVEPWSADSRHYLVLRDLAGGEVVALLEILSSTNKGCYSRADYEAFVERRQRLLSGTIAYLEVDAVPAGTRWLPACLGDLKSYAGVAWSSIPDAAGRRFQGWAWDGAGPLAKVPWDLGRHGRLEVDLDLTFREALLAAGFSFEP
ncbi:MAG: DUF4058 family protein [Planctomycetes bacterium]|nr:DUF4058 family protein [Planctomycetota bacterium]